MASQGLYRTQIVWSRVSPAVEDVAVIDMGWVHYPSSSQSSVAAIGAIHDTTPGITAGDATAFGHLVDELENFIVDISGLQTARVTSHLIKVTRMDSGHPTPNAAVYTRAESFQPSNANPLPPQVAMTATFHTASRRNWGRIYLPGLDRSVLDTYGRFSHSACDSLRDQVRDLWDDVSAFDWYPVVFKKIAPNGECNTVISLSVDDVADVQRRRRFDAATYHATSTI